VRPRFGLRAHRPIGQTDSFLGILSCLSQFPVRLNQQLAIDPHCPSKTHRRMSCISRPASLRLASRRANQCDLIAHAPDCVRRAAQLSCDNRAPGELRSPGPVAFAGARLCSFRHRRVGKETQELSLSRRGTAVPGLQQLPSLDSLMTSKSVDGLSELA
jgi:hypothetical protein